MSLAGARNMFWGSETASDRFFLFLLSFTISRQMEESLYLSSQPVNGNLLVNLEA